MGAITLLTFASTTFHTAQLNWTESDVCRPTPPPLTFVPIIVVQPISYHNNNIIIMHHRAFRGVPRSEYYDEVGPATIICMSGRRQPGAVAPKAKMDFVYLQRNCRNFQ